MNINDKRKEICSICPNEIKSSKEVLGYSSKYGYFCSINCSRIYHYHEALKKGQSREEFLREEEEKRIAIKQLEEEKDRKIKTEIERLTRIFEKENNLVIRLVFGKQGEGNFIEKDLKTNGLCYWKKKEGLFEINIRLDRKSDAQVFYTLAHEFSHSLTWGFSHLPPFWKKMDEITLPFVRDNLIGYNREELISLSQPSTNEIEKLKDWVYLEARKGNLYLKNSIDKKDVDRIWEIIRNETLKGDLGVKAEVWESKKSPGKYWIWIYPKNCKDIEDINRIRKNLLEKLNLESVLED